MYHFSALCHLQKIQVNDPTSSYLKWLCSCSTDGEKVHKSNVMVQQLWGIPTVRLHLNLPSDSNRNLSHCKDKLQRRASISELKIKQKKKNLCQQKEALSWNVVCEERPCKAIWKWQALLQWAFVLLPATSAQFIPFNLCQHLNHLQLLLSYFMQSHFHLIRKELLIGQKRHGLFYSVAVCHQISLTMCMCRCKQFL